MTDFNVAEIFAELRNEFASLAEHKGLRLEFEACGDCVHSDPSLIEQVLRNLVSNAIKYTKRGFVQLRCLHDEAFVRLEVLDTGIGPSMSAQVARARAAHFSALFRRIALRHPIAPAFRVR